ncbi:MAG TPA: hypothetical protein PKJ25_10650 [Smithellaceae bacterium]|mgnify:FL=1|jgi:hypothetical protein|nr:hypothetical protein [Smithellaceae bacterium]HPL97608.1 hypothetical protein [Smithellaceae bacterium]HQM44058.1 hypothetical protein [Smithellaceae bacterium]
MTNTAYELKKNVSIQDEQNDEKFVASEARPLIPEGVYRVCCVKAEKAVSHFRSFKMFLTFKIINFGQYSGTELFMAMNLINTRTGKPFKQVPSGSKYYEQWVIANRNIHPARNDRMSSRIFMNGVFEAVVRTVKPKFPDGTEKPECFHYSVVDYIKKRIE